MNGLCNKRFEDGVTFSSEKGVNVADYFNVSSDLSVDTLLSFFEIALRVDYNVATCGTCTCERRSSESRGLHSVRAFRHGLVYLCPCLRV